MDPGTDEGNIGVVRGQYVSKGEDCVEDVDDARAVTDQGDVSYREGFEDGLDDVQPRLHLILDLNPHRAPNTRFIRRDHSDTLLFRQLIALSKRVPAPE